jgi:sarcosine oxidase subunit delta
MSFLLQCPNCGTRGAYEFRFGGEYNRRPAPDAADSEWNQYVYNRANINGVQKEWWYHREGCGRWFLAERDTTTNTVSATYWPEESTNVSRE